MAPRQKVEDMKTTERPTVCIIRNERAAVSETFIDAQQRDLPCRTITLWGEMASSDTKKYYPATAVGQARFKLERIWRRKEWSWAITQSYCAAFKELKPDVAVAQYGPVGVRIAEACRLRGIPLIVYFRGYDAHVSHIVDAYRERYRALFRQAHSIVAVSRGIQRRLIELGAAPDKVVCQSSGVDCSLFQARDPGRNPPVFLAVGRLVEKKAPHLTLLAFDRALKQQDGLRLRIIGDGPLLGVCNDIVSSLGIGRSVEMLGAQPHLEVVEQMGQVRGFLQHSVTALNGDSEGTPNAVMEASASGLPVVATIHAGISDIVVHQKTGLLVRERDIETMSNHILALARDPKMASAMGIAGRDHVCAHFSRARAQQVLLGLIHSAISGTAASGGARRPIGELVS
jgi:glycosyltransferase involved in cell wall biosynthesis